MAEPNAFVAGVAEDPARSVLEAHGFTPEVGESAVAALGWALGEGIAREATLREFAHAVIDTLNVQDLVDAQIELLAEYKLEYPQDYEPDEVARMRTEIARLESLREELGE
ncbi:hypothetical protein [Saccharopolyspora shandongensis]|uniref:hypothetical protein n=1 Tax=Saccharopolyspora shandongensis TaxID=418495 RepID=UPI0033FD46BD